MTSDQNSGQEPRTGGVRGSLGGRPIELSPARRGCNSPPDRAAPRSSTECSVAVVAYLSHALTPRVPQQIDYLLRYTGGDD